MKRLAQIIRKNLKIHDFKQGRVGNCGLITSLAALSRRPEFLKEIAPKIVSARNGKKLQFKMFSRGNPIKVSVDENLPLDDAKSLIYAGSARNSKFRLASYFEKAFVKQACFNSYKKSDETDPIYALTSFSNCMCVRNVWIEKDSKQSLFEFIESEINNKSSLVLAINPDLSHTQEKQIFSPHGYTVIDYDCHYKAVKLYEPNCSPNMCVSDKKLPLSLTMNADAAKGELWVSIDQLEKRYVSISCLLPKKMYKTIFHLNEDSDFSFVDKTTRKAVWKVSIKEPSTFLINFFSFSHFLKAGCLSVFTDDSDKQEQDLDSKNSLRYMFNKEQNKDKLGLEKSSAYHRFELKPNKYEFVYTFWLSDEDLEDKLDDFFLKIGCTSNCNFS